MVRICLLGLLTFGLYFASRPLLFSVDRADALVSSALASPTSKGDLEDPPYVGLEHHFSDGKHRAVNKPGGMWIEHQTRKQSRQSSELHLVVENRSPVVGHVVAYLTRRALNIAPGEQVHMAGMATLAASDKLAEVSLGFHAYGSQGQYVGELANPESMLVNGIVEAQPLTISHARINQGGLKSGRNDIEMLSPRFAVYNISPGAKLTLKANWSAASIAPFEFAFGPTIKRWPAPLTIEPGGLWRFDVLGTGRSEGSNLLMSTIELRNGTRVAFRSARPAKVWNQDGAVRDPWRLRLPQELEVGRYEAWLELRHGTRLVASGLLGNLQVTNRRGMWIGQAYHRYPGISESTIGPLTLNHQFVRSLASDAWNPNDWWLGVDQYRWGDVDKWARYHAPNGGQRLLIVFSGTPTWASSQPTQHSSMELPGYAAPPRKSLYPAYARMVKATLERLKGRVMGVECWNEPDLAGFFTGTSTELADLCQIVHDAARAIDKSIPVICPQTASVRTLSLVMSAKTSDGRALHEFCDLIGSHIYGALGDDAQGLAYDDVYVADLIRNIQSILTTHKLQKDVAITEYGLSNCKTSPTAAYPVSFMRMNDNVAGEALYQSLSTLSASGVGLVALYSYDEFDTDHVCRPGGSRVRMLYRDRLGRQRPNDTVIQRYNQAVREFGYKVSVP